MLVLLLKFLIVTSLIFSCESTKKRNEHSEIKKLVDTSDSEIPKNEETCFSPDDIHCAKKLASLLSSAEKSIYIAIYDLNSDEITTVINSQNKKKSIDLRIIADKRQVKADKKSKISELIDAGINVRFGCQKGIMHHKFSIVDNEIVQTGSFNYTNSATLKNQENQIYLTSKNIVKKYTELFEKKWKLSRKPSEPDCPEQETSTD